MKLTWLWRWVSSLVAPTVSVLTARKQMLDPPLGTNRPRRAQTNTRFALRAPGFAGIVDRCAAAASGGRARQQRGRRAPVHRVVHVRRRSASSATGRRVDCRAAHAATRRHVRGPSPGPKRSRLVRLVAGRRVLRYV